MSKFYQGQYLVENEQKYIGNKKPIFRSSWEKRMCTFFDTSRSVIKWGSEIVVIPYIYSIDQKEHKYYTDFYAEIIDKQGNIKKWIVEVKPYKQTLKPKEPKNKTKKAMKNYMYAINTYIKNQDKWKYAKEFCDFNNLIFKIITEKNIF